uniref:BZIP domain-containing protein n=1 Tax=Capra hircus TaxID=9925 RepID=A0A8C2NVG0_CAPHI
MMPGQIPDPSVTAGSLPGLGPLTGLPSSALTAEELKYADIRNIGAMIAPLHFLEVKLGKRPQPVKSELDEEEERRKRRREKNKVAAARCRNKKKERTEFLQRMKFVIVPCTGVVHAAMGQKTPPLSAGGSSGPDSHQPGLCPTEADVPRLTPSSWLLPPEPQRSALHAEASGRLSCLMALRARPCPFIWNVSDRRLFLLLSLRISLLFLFFRNG